MGLRAPGCGLGYGGDVAVTASPWLKFYPSDWRADPALRMCSIGARGLWMEMLCVMHEASPRGSLLINGRHLTPRQLASLAGVSVDEVEALLAELEEAGVFSRDEGGQIYSRRMRRDDEKAAQNKEYGHRGGNPALKGRDNPADKAEDKAQILLPTPKPVLESYSGDERAVLALEFDKIDLDKVLEELVVWASALPNCRTSPERKNAIYGALKKRQAKAEVSARLMEIRNNGPPATIEVSSSLAQSRRVQRG